MVLLANILVICLDTLRQLCGLKLTVSECSTSIGGGAGSVRIEVATMVARHSKCTIKEVPGMKVVDAVRSFIRSLIIL
jgi:hypothetical protein